MEGHPGGRGVLEAKSLEAKYEAKLEFPGGMGVQNKKNLPCGELWIFSGTAQWQNSMWMICIFVGVQAAIYAR